MRTPHRIRCLTACAVLGILAGVPALAAQDPDKAAEKQARKELRRAAFIRGEAASKGERVVLPRTEAEAVAAARRVVPPRAGTASAAARRVQPEGLIMLPVSQDRLVNLVSVRRADGSYTAGHAEPAAPAEEIK